jgi:SAM-dependent methyltransferase
MTQTAASAGTPAQTAQTAEAFVERLFGAVLGAQFVQAAYLGDRLGYYRALATEALTAPELAARTATAARYAREWLEHQAVGGVLTVDDPTAEPDQRRFRLPSGHAEALTDVLSPNHVLPLARMVAGLGRQMDALVDAYRSGGGVSWAQFGTDARESQAAANRPLFLGALPRDYFPSVPALRDVLDRGGRIADVGCGYGWSAIGLALAHPTITVDGYDVDEPSIAEAQRNALEAGVADRVRFHHADAGTADGHYDLVTAFECIHDMPAPVGMLATMRRIAGPDGIVLVMDERVAETFHAPGDEIEQLMYGWSITCCLPDGLSHTPSVGTGTVMRSDTLRRYAREAGFNDIETLPIDDDFFRFYLMR